MVRWLGFGWEELYKIVKDRYEKCKKLGRYLFILTTYGMLPLKDDKGNYAVQLRCGMGETHVPGLGGMVGGLTKEQWLFIRYSTPKPLAILAVGPKWPGFEKAKELARRKGVTVKI